MDLSIVVPLYNEAENVRAVCDEIRAALDPENCRYEILLIDDGSQDGSWDVMRELAGEDSRIRLIRFRRNFGQTAAMAAGFDHARGKVIVPMDGDLQNDPRDISRLVARLKEGYDVVSGWRKKRQDKALSRRLPSVIANRLISRMTGVVLHDYGCTLKAYRREVLDGVNLYGELHRFVPALASQIGARVTEIEVNHRPRNAGVSKYGIDRTLRVILDLLTVRFLLGYATRPLQLFGKWGLLAILLGGVSGLTTLYMKLFEGLNLNRNPLLILTAFLLFSGVQFIALGLLGELVTRTYYEGQGKPVYTIRSKVNFED
ncbi:glycosyltransferase involved in cell wall biosynthesis [Geothermobacter ehrlichii]|uniref:Glycosyltransferase involved in cell wall biosynthesis n=1 Tax=Geothermobacter ehrlichii TaxID=213224 RepID=A0A5D3WE90_9BACT|nr:glycosyltransferase family 2 protein [Geothermobacter ehrlichii]TYO95045.1 glycosyltransferase involved in cell wall biosynthesis [Geothermobacter ehrlichii]